MLMTNPRSVAVNEAWRVKAGDEPSFTWESIPDGQTFTSETLEGLQEFLDMRAAAHRLADLEAELTRLRRVEEVAKRLRQWDMLNGYIGGDGERHEPTADAPYWRAELDRVLQPNVASEPKP